MLNFLCATKDKKIVNKLSRLTAKICTQDLSVEGVFSYEQCREKMVVFRPDMLILDKGLFGEEEETLQFLRSLRISYPGCVLIVIGEIKDSAYSIRKFFREGIYDYWFKPLEDNLIIETLKSACDILDNKSKQDIPEIERNFNELIPALKNSLFYGLIFGNLKNAKEIWKRSKLVGLSSTPNIVMVTTIDNYAKLTVNKSEHWKQLLKQELFQVVQEALQTVSGILLGIVAADSIAVLLTIEQEHEAWMMKEAAIALAEKIKYSVENDTNMTVSIGIGNYYEDARNLHLSYAEALIAQGHKFFIGNNQVIHISDVEPFTYNVRILPYEKESELLNKLRLGERVEARECLQEIMQEMLMDRNIDPATLKIQAMELLVMLARVANEGGAGSEKLLSIQFKFAWQLQEIEVAEQLEKWMYEVLESYLELVLENHNLYNLKAVQQGIKFIEENFNQELSLESVAGQVCLSPNYFSSIFKKEVGRTFIEYLTELRIKKAKELLDDLENNIAQVATQVGYQDPRYFSRVFRTVVGVPPTAYRNRN